jgi:hypothetical protein
MENELTLASLQKKAYRQFDDKHNVLQKIMIGNIFGGVAAFILVFFLIGKWTLHRNFLHFHELINSNSFTPVLIMLCIGVISLIPFAISMYLCFYWYPKRVGKRKEVQRAYLQTLIEKLYQTEQNLLPDIKKIDTLAEQEIESIREAVPRKKQYLYDSIEEMRKNVEQVKKLLM